MNYSESYIKKLNGLLHLVNDSNKGYKEAVARADSQDLKDLFSHIAQQRESLARELEDRIHSYSGDVKAGSEFKASLHRSWMGIKTAMTKKDDQAVMESCRNGDQVVLDAYDDMLQGDLLNDTSMKTFLMGQRLIINEAFMEIDRRYFDLFNQNPAN